MFNWETIREEIFENAQLDIYEKMCLLVLMSIENESEEIQLSSEELARFMGCGLVTAKRAFDSLRLKGYFVKDYQKEPPKAYESAVIKNNEEVVEVTRILETFQDDFKEGFFTTEQSEQPPLEEEKTLEKPKREPIDPEAERRRLLAEYLLAPEPPKNIDVQSFQSQKEKKESLVDTLIEFIDEKISSKEANILLGFAGNDIERIKREYKKAKASQVSDKVGYLINALQKKESHVIKSGDLSKVSTNTQVDTNRLRKMQAYRQNNLK